MGITSSLEFSMILQPTDIIDDIIMILFFLKYFKDVNLSFKLVNSLGYKRKHKHIVIWILKIDKRLISTQWEMSKAKIIYHCAAECITFPRIHCAVNCKINVIAWHKEQDNSLDGCAHCSKERLLHFGPDKSITPLSG